jgi:DNA-binding NarL/FixJ family response regulator
LLNKGFRILIADTQHFHRMRIERLFNQLGYFAVAPAQSLEEMLLLTEYASQPFDLVVINGSMADGSLNLPNYFVDNRQVRQAFVFNARQAHRTGSRQKVWISPGELPDLATIKWLMATIDAQLPLVGTVISVR